MNLFFCENCRTVYLSEVEDEAPACTNFGLHCYGTPCSPVNAVYTMRNVKPFNLSEE